MIGLISALCFWRKKDFTSRVLDRYRSNKPVSSFARDLSSEDADTINARFAKVKRQISR